MARKLLLALSVSLLLPLALSADIIVLKSGHRIEAQGSYTISQGQVHFTGVDGKEFSYPIDAVDFLSTEKATAQARTRETTKVWTNDDINRLKGAPLSVTGSTTPAPAAEEAAAAEGQAAAPAEDEGEAEPPPQEQTREYWQERLQPLQEELQRIDQEIQTLRRGQNQAASNTIDFMSGNPGVQVEDTIRRLEQRRRQVERQIADLRDEARRYGVPAGWVR